MKERLFRIWHQNDDDSDFAGRVREKIHAIAGEASKRSLQDGEYDLPKTLPDGALGAKDPPKQKPPSTPTEIVYESEESEEEHDQSPPRTPTPESSELDLSNDEHNFKRSGKKDKTDQFNLRLKDNEYDGKNRPKPKFQKSDKRSLFGTNKTPKRTKKKKEDDVFMNLPWNPSNNPSPGFDSKRR